MKRRWMRIALASAVLFVVVEIASCQIMDSIRTPVTADGLVREFADAGAFRTSYLRPVGSDGHAPRIVYVHGTPGSAGAFERYLLRPIPGWESISVDRPGFGMSVPQTPVPALADQARAIAPLLEVREGVAPVLVGHSLGGAIIARAAVDYPERVGGLVILSGSMDPALEKVYWYQRLAEFLFVPYMIPRSLRNANRELFPLKAELEALAPRLAEVRCPVVIVHARNDLLVPYANVGFMEAAFANAASVDLVTLETENHFIPWNAEDAVREAIGGLLERLL